MKYLSLLEGIILPAVVILMSADTSSRNIWSVFLSICEYIDAHCTEDITLDEIAKIAGFSKYHFTRLFKQFTNNTFYKYLNQKRIELALTFLADPNISVTEAAMQSGFTNPSTFIRGVQS